MAKKSSRKFRFNKNMLPIAAVVVVASASIAYASFTQILNVAGTGTISGNWDVRVVSITKEAGSVGETDVATYPKVIDTSHVAFSSNLAYPGATATYDVTVQNFGTIPAYLDNITDPATVNASAPAGVKYTIDPTLAANSGTPASATHLDEAGHAGGTDTKMFTVKVEWLSTDTGSYTSGANKTLNLALGWNQYTP